MVGESLREAEMRLDGSEQRPVRGRYVSTGSSLLNLACSGRVFGGFLAGKYYLLVGDASAGKTFLAMSCLAEACLNSKFADYRLIYDNVEDGCLLDIETLFHAELARRLEPPGLEGSTPVYSATVEEFYYNLDDAIQGRKPFIYVLDSMDALTSVDEEDKFDQQKKASRRGKEVSGSYGVSKARKNSEGLRKALHGLRESGSILIVLSQTRDDLGFGFSKKTRSGGRALRFYATIEMWASVVGAIKKSVRGKTRQVGVKVQWKVKKNRIIGGLHEVGFDIYPSYGIDDVGSCVDYLVEEGWWKERGKIVRAESFGLTEQRSRLITIVERKGLVRKLRKEVQRCWNDVEVGRKLKRRRRYALAAD